MTDVSVCAAVVPGGIATGMHTFIPHSVKRPPSDEPWFNKQCLRAVSAKDSAYRVWCKHSSSENRAKYIDAKNSCKTTINRAKEAYDHRIRDKLINFTVFWVEILLVIGKGCWQKQQDDIFPAPDS